MASLSCSASLSRSSLNNLGSEQQLPQLKVTPSENSTSSQCLQMTTAQEAAPSILEEEKKRNGRGEIVCLSVVLATF